jgi:Flagellar protein FliT
MTATLDRVPLMEAYEIVAKDSRDLLAAARAADWSAFDRIQAECRAHVAEIRENAGPREFTAAQKRRRRQILVGILGDDRAIRDILEPTTRRFEALMQLRLEREGGAD